MKAPRFILGCAASVLAPFLILLVVVLFWITLSRFVRTGTATGVVASLEQRGLIVRTWEGRMTDGLTFSVDPSASQREYNLFLLTESLQHRTPVRIDYTDDVTAAPWRGSSLHLVTSVSQVLPTP